MARFFLHIYNGTGPQLDDVGEEFADARQAVGEAAKTAGEILRDETHRDLCDRDVRIVIEDESKAAVAEVAVTLSLAGTNLR